MYQIFCNPDGTFDCIGRLQDGTEHWKEVTLEAAIKSLKQFAKTMNGTKIKKRGIAYYKLKDEPQWVQYDPFA